LVANSNNAVIVMISRNIENITIALASSLNNSKVYKVTAHMWN